MTDRRIDEKQFQRRLCASIEAAWPGALVKLASDTASLVALPGGKWTRRKQPYGGKGFPDIIALTLDGQTSVTPGRWVLRAWECKVLNTDPPGGSAGTVKLESHLSAEQIAWLDALVPTGVDVAVAVLFMPRGISWPDATLCIIPWQRYRAKTEHTPYSALWVPHREYLPHLLGRDGGWRLRT